MSDRKWTRIFCAALILFVAIGSLSAQEPESLIKDLSWRNIGPANMSGRISDIEALESDFSHVLVASASGGVWKSDNAGTTWEPIFDTYSAASIGDIALCQSDPDIIWVGTGERNPRNSIAWGDGIYKSTDGGETFAKMGLDDTHSIGRIIIHPDNPDVVFVAAAGHLWGYSGDRGLYKTENGGRTWTKITNGLPDDGRTGAIDMIINPENPDIMFVAFWERLRRPWRFDSGGPDGGLGNGGLYKSTDGGDSWRKLEKGLPQNGPTGKIGLAISRSNPDVVMAWVEHGFQPRQGDDDYEDMSKLGTGVYRSENLGEDWELMNRFNNRPFYYSHIYINPLDDEMVYLLYSGFYMSRDGGKTLEAGPRGIHGDFHAMWLDPTYKDRFYIGSDGGVGLTHNHKDYVFFDNYVISQFYAVGVDMRDPYYVYGGLQDNGTWGGPSKTRDSRGILTDLWFSIGGGDGFHAQVDPTDWRTVYVESQQGSISRRNAETRGGGGIRPSQRNTVNYDEFMNDEIAQRMRDLGWRTPFRFNWSSPIVMSPHNPHTIFFGGNHLFKTLDKGETWYIISPDLSTNDPIKMSRDTGGITRDATGAENHCTIITISESPMKAGVIWAGTDDGNVQITRNGGATWTNVRRNIPDVAQELWCSRVEASHFEVGTCYVSFDGHRSDNFEPWVFKTTDFGATWTNISSNLPDREPVYVIKQDLRNPDLLFVGTEFSCFYSIDNGERWTRLNKNMPTVAVHDLVIHPRDNDLIAGTHGRGIWIMDDIAPLQQATADVLASEAFLFENRPATQWLNIRTGGRSGHLWFAGENPPSDAAISYFIGAASGGEASFVISDITGDNRRTLTVSVEPGIGRLHWNMRFDPTPEQVERFLEQTQSQLDRYKEEATREQRSMIEEIEELIKSGRPPLQILEDVMEKMSEMTGSTSRGVSGPQAEPGTYRVTMTYLDQTYTSTIILRSDPLEK